MRNLYRDFSNLWYPDGYGPRNSFLSRKNSMNNGWKLSGSFRCYFMDLSKNNDKNRAECFIESMNLKAQNLFFMGDLALGSDIGRSYWLDCSYLFVCLSAYL